MRIDVHNRCSDFNSYRAARVKSLFNAENGCDFKVTADLDIDDGNWQIGLIVGPSGSGKSSLGSKIFGGGKIYDMYTGWSADKPIIDDIAPEGDFNAVTATLAAVGLGDVPAWLRPFHVLSTGQKFRAGLARLIAERPSEVVVDEFTSVVDRQIARIGAAAFQKAWRRGPGKVVLLSCHYDIVEWLEPDWVYDTASSAFARGSLWRRPPINISIWKTDQSYWRVFKPHYYLDLPMPVAAMCFVGTYERQLVCHVTVSPMFTAGAYRATRLVVLPEWQGVGVGLKFLTWVCDYHLRGNGRCGKKYPTFFHTSHPQLAAVLRKAKGWTQTGAQLYGSNKAASKRSLERSQLKRTGSMKATAGYGGHFRAIQAFKYIGGGV